MTWVLAGAYVLAGVALTMAVQTRVDPVVMAASGVPATPDRPVARWSRSPRALAFLGIAIGVATAIVDPITAMLAAPVLGAAGHRLPGFRRAREVAARRARVSADVPDLLDVVAVSVTAGLSPRLALERGAEAASGPLGVELVEIRRDVTLGGTWRAGFRDAARRLDLPEFRRLAIILERGERLGAPVADRLRSLAREVRAARRARREERARQAPVAMLFPLVFLILPAFVLAAVAPAVLVAIRGVS